MTKLEQAARQALEALEVYGEHAKYCPQYPTYTRPQDYPKCDCGYEEAITALREALAEQAEQEPVAIMSPNKANIVGINAPHANIGTNGWIPLCAAPVRTKDLTDDEIMKINVDTASIVPTCDRQFHFARAVIAADREKNK